MDLHPENPPHDATLRRPGSDTPRRTTVKALRVYLIRPSKYDDDGYVVRHWRGIIPSNTLACLAGLTEDVRRRDALAGTRIHLRTYDEGVDTIPTASICRRARRERDCRTIVCLVGVQSCMFNRAADLAAEFRSRGVDVLIGGFHVSGATALVRDTPPEVQQLLDIGVVVVLGEVEHRWEAILRDAVCGELRPVYDFMAERPCLDHVPPPVASGQHMKRYALQETATIDTSRGCPFDCSFCTIINVQGRTIRARSVESMTDILRHNYRKRRVTRYFFTDDNFARNPNAMAILEVLERLRTQERMPIEFMMQADVAAYRIPGFVERASAAGCYAVFIGMESLNPKNLAAAGKKQNQPKAYGDMTATWRRAGISTQVGYIIGFPHDTVASVRDDLRRLREEVQPDMASFFMLVPLPGSRDHQRMQENGQWMHPDLNRYDGHHATTRHPHLSREEWTGLYQEAWESFYSFDNMKGVLQRVHPRLYWPLLNNFLWYKWSSLCERGHPMLTGLFRLKDRQLRRPGYAVDGVWTHLKTRLRETGRYVRDLGRLFLEMEDLWLQTRPWSPLEYRLVEAGRHLRRSAANWITLDALAEQFRASRRHASRRWGWFMSRWLGFSTSGIESRRYLADSWDRLLTRWRRRKWLGISPVRGTWNTAREIRLALSFASAMLAQA